MGTARDKVDGQGRSKVECLECGGFYHRVDEHVVSKHSMTVEQYLAAHTADGALPDLVSSFAKERIKLGAGGKPKRALRSVDEGDARIFLLGAARLAQRDPDDLSDEDARLVPAHDEKYQPGKREMQQWEAMALAIEAHENVLIVGPTGSGKSSAVMELAACAGQPLRRINLHGDVRGADFLGEKTIDVDPSSGQAIVAWRDGVLPTAMRRGHWLLLDELDAAPPQILFALQGVLETRGRLVLAGNGGEVIAPHEKFRVIATANTLGRGDEAGLYSGTNVLNEAFLDRFGVVIEAQYPDRDTEARILVERTGVRPETARKMVEVATKVREAAEKEECYCTFSTRRLISWADKAKRLNRSYDAAVLTVTNRLSGDDRKFVDDIIVRLFPKSAREYEGAPEAAPVKAAKS